MTLRELRDKRAAVAKNMQAVHATAEKEDRGFTPEEQAQWDAQTAELKALDERIKRAEEIETRSDEADDETRERDDRIEFERRRRANDDDANRPLTSHEEARGFLAWCLGTHCRDDQGIRFAQRMGLSYRNTIELQMDRGHDESGQPFSAPKSFQEVERQAECRARNLAERERRGRDSIESRAQSLSATAGGNTVPDSMMQPLDRALLQFGGMRAVSTIISTASGSAMPIPTTNDTTNKGRLLTENTQVTGTDVVFGQLVLDAYKFSSDLILVSLELMQDTAINLPQVLGSMLGERLGRLTNDYYTTGTGTSQPKGIVAGAANSSITAGSAGVITFQEVLGLIHSVDPAYRERGGALMCNDATLLVLKKQADSQNRPLWLPSVAAGNPGTLCGFPIYTNQSMAGGAAAKGLIFGDLSKYIIRDVMGIQLTRLDERYADFHQVGFLAVMRSDGDLLNAGTNPVKYMTLA